MASCGTCVYFKCKKQWCVLHDVPVHDELYCEKFKGV